MKVCSKLTWYHMAGNFHGVLIFVIFVVDLESRKFPPKKMNAYPDGAAPLCHLTLPRRGNLGMCEIWGMHCSCDSIYIIDAGTSLCYIGGRSPTRRVWVELDGCMAGTLSILLDLETI